MKPDGPSVAAARPGIPSARASSAGSRLAVALGHGAPYLAAIIGSGAQTGDNGENPLAAAVYSGKVLAQMENEDDIYHSFPIMIDEFAEREGIVSLETSGDGIARFNVRLQGVVNDQEGDYRYIIDENNEVVHRQFEKSDGPASSAEDDGQGGEAEVEAQAFALAEAEDMSMDGGE